MKINYAIICFIGLCVSACKWGAPSKQSPASPRDTLKYTFEVIKQRANDCGNKPDSECTLVNIKYPVFTGQKLLNDTVQHKMLSLFALNDGKDTTIKQQVASFFEGYSKNKKSNKQEPAYTMDLAAKVLHQDSDLAVLEFDGYTFTGGAHGGSESIYANWDIKANKKISLNDIMIDGYQDKLNKTAEHIFRTQEKLNDTTSLTGAYFFDKGKFTLNNNYALMPAGISFLYNEYEIKSYAEGITKLFIPYAEIKSLLRPGSVIAQYIK